MKTKKRSEGQIKALRLRTEKILELAHVPFQKISQKEIKDLVHSLQVYQIELEMQNEELRSSHETIKLLEGKYFKLYDLAPCGYLTMDEKGKIKEANIAAAQILGVNRKFLIKSPFPSFLTKDSWGIFSSVREKLFESGKRQECELMIRKKGVEFSYIWFICNISENKEGEPRILNASMADISAIKGAEEILQRDKDVLERLVKERTTELLNAQEKLLMTKRLSDIGQLASTIAHELRNPLGVIKAAAYNIGRKSKNPELAKHLDNINKKISESDQIIQNLLGYAHLNVPIYEMADIGLVLGECIEDMRERRMGFDVQIDKKMAFENGFFIECDRTQITELFSNILDNSYNALREKKGRIEIRGALDEGGKMLKISFKDDGDGIDEEHIDRVFEPFFSKRTRGIGLGLTICRQIVDLHGGAIDITSKKGAGTTVTISLPIKHISA